MNRMMIILALGCLASVGAIGQIRRDNVLVPRPDTVRVVDTVRVAAECGTGVAVGFLGGINRVGFSQKLEWTPKVTNSPLQNLASGVGWGVTVGGFLETPLSRASEDVHLRVGVGYSAYAFERVGESGAYDVQVGTPPTTQPGAVRHSYKADVSYIDLSALLRWSPFPAPIYFTVGPLVSSRASDLTFEETEQVEFPIGGVFPGTVFNKQTRTTVVPKATFLRYGIVGGVGGRIPLGNNLALVVDAQYRLMVTPVAEDEVSRAADGGGDPSRELSGSAADLMFSERTMDAVLFTIGIAVDL